MPVVNLGPLAGVNYAGAAPGALLEGSSKDPLTRTENPANRQSVAGFFVSGPVAIAPVTSKLPQSLR